MLLAKEPEDQDRTPLAEARRAAQAVRFLMCPPRHFAVSYSINPWMDPRSWADNSPALTKTAEQQWSAFQTVLVAQGAAVDVVEPAPDLPDLVFTANAAVVLDGKALLARFRHMERRGEEPIFNAAFEGLKTRAGVREVVPMPEDVYLEGAGDCIWDPARKHFWMGFGQRSHESAAGVVEDTFGRDCVALALADPSFYHLDTAFCPLHTGDVIYYPEAFTLPARARIEARVAPAQRIALSQDEAKQFSANAVCFDHRIVMSSCPDALRSKLAARGFTVLTTPLQAFLMSGGSACCLTLRLDHASVR